MNLRSDAEAKKELLGFIIFIYAKLKSIYKLLQKYY